jgi:anti-anti-sigma factor
MEIAVEDLAGGATKVVLRGRFDSTGAVVVELPFQKVATEQRRIAVDLAGVNFLSSYGVRVLLVGAKLAAGKGGRMVLVSPNDHVTKVLKIAGADTLIPTFRTLPEAEASLAAP